MAVYRREAVFFVCLCRFQRVDKHHMAAATHRAECQTRGEAEIKSRLKRSHIAQLYTQITLPVDLPQDMRGRHLLPVGTQDQCGRPRFDLEDAFFQRDVRVSIQTCSAAVPRSERENPARTGLRPPVGRDMRIPCGFCDSRISIGLGERRPA